MVSSCLVSNLWFWNIFYNPASSIRPSPIISSFFPRFVRLCPTCLCWHSSWGIMIPYLYLNPTKAFSSLGRGCIVCLCISAPRKTCTWEVCMEWCAGSHVTCCLTACLTHIEALSYLGQASGFGIVCGWLSYMLLTVSHPGVKRH